jgi:hypothetical protein
MTRVAEQHQSLLIVTASPAVWAAHFLVCYVTAAVWCAKQSTALAPLAGVRTAIVVYTAAALLAIVAIGWFGYRAHRFGGEEVPHDADSAEDRHRFIGFATLLLSGLSGLAVVYVALVPVFVRTCQ